MRFTAVCLTAIFAGSSFFVQGQTAESPAKDTQATEIKGLPPRATPGDYPSQMKAGAITIAAEFTGHSVPKPEGPLATEDFVVVEAAFFGAPDARLKLSVEDFTLRVNGKKTNFSSQPYGMVLRSLKDPSWAPPEEEEAKKSKGGLSTGGAQAANDSLPVVVHVPIELQRAMAQYVQKASLPEGDRRYQ